LEQKAVDGIEMVITFIDASKYYEVTKYIIETNHQFTCYETFINEKFWNTLSADYQNIIAKAVKEAEDRNLELALKQMSVSRAHIESEGVIFTVPDQALRQQMVDAQAVALSRFFEMYPEAEYYTKKIDALR
jgi:TRAP-type C4-dicarboxylate transport system substrate-binding protein